MLSRLATTLLLATVWLNASADDHQHAHSSMHLEASQAWSRAMPPTAPTGAVYFTLHNPGDAEDRLIGVKTPRAEKAELHAHIHEGDLMRMERIDGVTVPPGGDVQFKPGGNHVMLFNLNAPLVAGEQFPLTLIFRDAGEIETEVTIRDQAPDTGGSTHAHH
ncbi:copper chaperone PCu(A)C [Stutzerimonas chloritidismutans]|uniref:copper chaperone PCu(A)C n=1 Tax=Stutzerimonas chloritidismutans TaxID=203192 RepID=UPI003F182C2E